MMESTTLTACASTVAIAAPATFIFNTATKSKSPAMFTTQAIVTNKSGIFESPKPLKMLLITLYAIINKMPPPQIRTYVTVSSKASSGTFIRIEIGFANTSMITVSINAIPKNSTTALLTMAPAFSGFSSPRNCEIRISTNKGSKCSFFLLRFEPFELQLSLQNKVYESSSIQTT